MKRCGKSDALGGNIGNTCSLSVMRIRSNFQRGFSFDKLP